MHHQKTINVLQDDVSSPGTDRSAYVMYFSGRWLNAVRCSPTVSNALRQSAGKESMICLVPRTLSNVYALIN